MRSLKSRWERAAHRLDAMSLRERALVFCALAVVLVVLVNTVLLDPLAKRDKIRLAQIKQNEENTAAMQMRIGGLIKSWKADPDVELRARLALLREQSTRAGKTLVEIQSSLVPPQRMTALLEDILRRNHSLRLLALKTLPVTGLVEPDPVVPGKAGSAGSAGSAQKAVTPGAVVYRHGVELTVSGSYAELVHYLV